MTGRMTQRILVGLLACGLLVNAAVSIAFAAPPRGRGFVLADEVLRFDADLRPQFSARQLQTSSEATRAGLVKWAATREGKAIIARFQKADREVIVLERPDEPTIGRAPQPSFVTLLAAEDAKQLKTYHLIVNPNIAAQYQGSKSIDLGLPRTPADTGGWPRWPACDGAGVGRRDAAHRVLRFGNPAAASPSRRFSGALASGHRSVRNAARGSRDRRCTIM